MSSTMSESESVDSESSYHPSKLRSLLTDNALRSGLSYLTVEPEASGQTFTNTIVTSCSSTARPGNPDEFVSSDSGYLLACNANNSDGHFNNMMMSYGEVEDNASVNHRFDVNSSTRDVYSHVQPGFIGYEVSSSVSSTISSPHPMPTSTTDAINTLPIFMSPMEVVKPCPQYCRCHGFHPVSSPDYNGNVYPMPDLLHNTKPDQFSSMSTSSTMCLTSPLVCPGHVQPLTSSSLNPSLPAPGSEGVVVGSSSISSLPATPIVNDPKSVPNEQQGLVYPVQVEVVPSDWLSTCALVKKGNVSEGNKLEAATPTTMIVNSVPEAEPDSSQTSFPALLSPTSSQNYAFGRLDGSSSQSLDHSPSTDVTTSNQQNTSYRNIYPRLYPGVRVYPSNPDVYHQPNFTFYDPSNIPPYPPPEYPSHPHPEYPCTSFGNNPQPGPGYHAYPSMMIHPMHHAQRPSGFFHRTGSSVMDKQFPGMPIPQPPAPCDAMVDEGVDDHGSHFNPCHGDDQRVKRQKTPRLRGRLVDQFPDLLPAVAWCMNYSQTSLSATLSAERIRKIIIESVPGIKDRGGIGMNTIRRLIHQVKNMPNKVGFDQTETTKTSMTKEASKALLLLAERAVDSNLEGNTTELPQDPADSSFRFVKGDDSSVVKPPAEPVLLSIMKLVDTIPKVKARSKSSQRVNSTARSLGSDAKSKSDVTASEYCNDSSTSDSTFQSLMEAHGIAEDEVRSLSNATESSRSPHSAGGHRVGDPPVEISSANDPSDDDGAKCNDIESNYVIVIDEDDDQNILKIKY